MSKPLVSVVIPSFNRGYIVREAIDSVLGQEGPEVEVIVADDGSTDDTAAVVAAYAGRVTYVRQENRGPGVARNLGVRAARGDYVSFLDSDDIWLPGKSQTEIELFESMPDIGVVASDADSWYEGALVDASWLVSKGVPMLSGEPFVLPADPPLWMRGSLFATSSLTIRRACLLKAGDPPFDPGLRASEDWDLEIRLLRFCKVLVLPKVLASIRRFPDGTRADRPTPGHDPTPEQVATALHIRLRVTRNAIRLGWPDEIQNKLLEARDELLARLAAHAAH